MKLTNWTPLFRIAQILVSITLLVIIYIVYMVTKSPIQLPSSDWACTSSKDKVCIEYRKVK